jgi:SAM-dependent methyltransferase
MLREHLSQKHDAASRGTKLVDRHVAWLHEHAIPRTRGSVLDLTCGPGLYTSRLARLGHRCFGVDISPASIEHARADAADGALACTYMLGDLRTAPLGAGHGAALLLFGELNAFPRGDVPGILERIHASLTGGGVLVLEVSTEAAVKSHGHATPTWYPSARSLFGDGSHLVLKESAWHPAERAATDRWLVVDAETAEVASYAATLEAWSDAEYEEAIRAAGFTHLERHPSLAGRTIRGQGELFVWTAARP